jgi:hypothetical protein
MDAERFDAILRLLKRSPARRHLLRLFAGSTLGLLAVEPRSAVAKKKRGKGKKSCPQCPDAPCVLLHPQ